MPRGVPFLFNGLRELHNGSIAASSDRGLVLLDDEPKIYSSESKIKNLRPLLREVSWVTLPEELTLEADFLSISDVLHDREGNLWVGITLPNEEGRLITFPESELNKSKLSQYQVFTSNDKISFGESQKMLQAEDGAIWVVNSSYKTGIGIFKNGEWDYLKLSDTFGGDEYMTNILQSDDGTIWIGSLGRLYRNRRGTWSLYSAPRFPVPSNRVLLQKSAGNYLWVTGYKSKVFFLDFSDDSWRLLPKSEFSVSDIFR